MGAEATYLKPEKVANVLLKDMKKVYPASNERKHRKKEGQESDEQVKLQITDEGVVAVQQFNLEVEDKEFVVLVGPSGCGKSTTLRMIAGLEEITEGELYIDGRIMNNIAPKDRDIAMVFQNYALYPHMTVYENMAFSLKLRKVQKKEIDGKVKEAADILGITELLKRRPKALSGGQRQRVAIGRAIVREPKVFLMDEPLSNLDAKLRNQMRAELLKLRQRINTTFVYVTHDQTEAMTLGDRIVVMNNGFIQQIGTPHEVFHHPANLFVAGFIGTPQMNFFDARLLKNGQNYEVELCGLKVALPDTKQRALADAGMKSMDIIAGIRPEHMHITKGNGINATVDVSEMMGSETFMHVSVQGKDAIIRTPTTELSEDFIRGTPVNKEIKFGISGELVHMFDPETTNNII
jgi:multiple sugar transport system ATP-binding protein